MATSRARASNKLAVVAVVTLATIVAAGEAGMFTSPDVHASLVQAGHVEINSAVTNEAGEIATRATPAGIAAVAAAPAADAFGAAAGAPAGAAAVEPVKEKKVFTIEDDVELPSNITRGGGRTEMYPFEALPAPKSVDDGKGGTRIVMASFFVANKEPKSLGSTVTGARNRYSVEVPNETRVMRGGKTVAKTQIVRDFKVMAAEVTDADGVIVKGSRIWRTK